MNNVRVIPSLSRHYLVVRLMIATRAPLCTSQWHQQWHQQWQWQVLSYKFFHKKSLRPTRQCPVWIHSINATEISLRKVDIWVEPLVAKLKFKQLGMASLNGHSSGKNVIFKIWTWSILSNFALFTQPSSIANRLLKLVPPAFSPRLVNWQYPPRQDNPPFTAGNTLCLLKPMMKWRHQPIGIF